MRITYITSTPSWAWRAGTNSILDCLANWRRKYLADKRYSLADVADRLGFVDASNFFHAAKRWFGVPPGQYRHRLLADVAAVAEAPS